MYNRIVLLAAAAIVAGAAHPAFAATAGMTGGVNLSGLEIGFDPGVYQSDYTTPTLSEMEYYCTTKGICLFRVPFILERLEPNLLENDPPGQQTLNAAYVALIQQVLANAASVGATVVLDMHDYGGYWDASQQLWHSVSTKTSGCTMGAACWSTPYHGEYLGWAWQQLATQLKGTPGLGGYDIQNEPANMESIYTWPQIAQMVTSEIRAVDSHTPIYIEGDCGAAAPQWVSCSYTPPPGSTSTPTGNAYLAIKGGHIIYEAHVYGDHDNSGTHYDWATEAAAGVTTATIADYVADFDAWCQSKHYACMIGETGVGNDSPNWNIELATGLAAEQAAGIVSFAYWAGGPWWGSYPLSIEPSGGRDAPQMSVVGTYGR